MSQLIVSGQWTDGASSAACPARLIVTDQHAQLIIEGKAGFSTRLEDITLSPKLGRTARYIRFYCHEGQLESLQHDQLDELDHLIGSKGMRFIHTLENHLGMVALATLTVLCLIFVYFKWGIPAAAKLVAQNLPENILQQSANDTLLVMQKRFLEPTKLDRSARDDITASIARYAPNYPIDKLHFFSAPDMGANAFALPDGTIVFTDEIVQMANGNDDELLAVFGHEYGHVQERHALRQILQNSSISLTIALVGGDVSSLGDIVLTLPVIFTQLSFSRDFEKEADQAAIQFLRDNQLDPKAFARILTKLHNSHGECVDQDNDQEQCKETAHWMEYLSTHPYLEERLKALEAAR